MAITVRTGTTEADYERVHGRLAAIVSELPGTVVSANHEHTAFLIGSDRFASLLVDDRQGTRLDLSIKVSVAEQAALVRQDPGRYFMPPNLGQYGWVTTSVDPANDPDWNQLAALIEQAWRLSADERAVLDFDARRRP